jgi:hypothetical protein
MPTTKCFFVLEIGESYRKNSAPACSKPRNSVTVHLIPKLGDSALNSAPALLPTSEAWLPAPAPPPRNDENAGSVWAGLIGMCASFETRPRGAPQDEGRGLAPPATTTLILQLPPQQTHPFSTNVPHPEEAPLGAVSKGAPSPISPSPSPAPKPAAGPRASRRSAAVSSPATSL